MPRKLSKHRMKQASQGATLAFNAPVKTIVFAAAAALATVILLAANVLTSH